MMSVGKCLRRKVISSTKGRFSEKIKVNITGADPVVATLIFFLSRDLFYHS